MLTRIKVRICVISNSPRKACSGIVVATAMGMMKVTMIRSQTG